MKERPILFSGPMVRALLAGTKTQTRRIMNPQPELVPCKGPRGGQRVITAWRLRDGNWQDVESDGLRRVAASSPYGVAGDRLWVRETLREGRDGESEGWVYSADAEPITLDETDPRVGAMISWAHHKEGSTCVSIHMPRWASRITLEITDVRVERLQSITEDDARAEGVLSKGETSVIAHEEDMHRGGLPWARPRFARLWDEINGKRAPWSSNPWVWVVSFKRLEQPARAA